MLDGVPTHTTKVTKNCIKDIDLKIFNWPPNSLDLNLIENIKMICKNRICNMKRSNVECIASKLEECTNRDVRQVIWKHAKTDTSCYLCQRR